MQKSITIAITILVSACAAKQSPGPDPWSSYGSSSESSHDGTSDNGTSSNAASSSGCEVRGRYGIMTYLALVRGNLSKSSQGIVKTTADRDGNVVVYHQGIIKAQAGLIEDTVAHLTLHVHDERSSPIVDGMTELSIPPGTLTITSRGCTTQEVAFGTIHLAALIITQRNQN